MSDDGPEWEADSEAQCVAAQRTPWGRHEVLHMSAFLMDAVANTLLEHQQIKDDPAWEKLAQTAFDSLYRLYLSIGAAHLTGDDNAQE